MPLQFHSTRSLVHSPRFNQCMWTCAHGVNRAPYRSCISESAARRRPPPPTKKRLTVIRGGKREQGGQAGRRGRRTEAGSDGGRE
ncbi:hypothetical protein K505DRAFT_60884 [Melanomma pulvis-pyrius CBS 109.77]|uniref:Uncharacterized protein n=1 Tax=Melanomma pulvis-pyrius CBS 109.77 TaxID=1314802 RepID=A0A6A6X6T3_9PLEO|nr:hypothetical protein K505DRAFT_60884 [Melanomma pulvis-pyrius CBS 109.77]